MGIIWTVKAGINEHKCHIPVKRGPKRGPGMGQKGEKTHFLARARRSPANSLLITFVIETVSFDDCLKTPNVWDPFFAHFWSKNGPKNGGIYP